MSQFELAICGLLLLIVVLGAVAWATSILLKIGQVISALQSLNESFDGLKAWLKSVDEKVERKTEDHEKRIARLEGRQA